MRVVVGNVDALVPDTVGDGNGGEAHVDQQRDMRMSEVVNSYLFHACALGPLLHLVVQSAVAHGEDTIPGADVIEGSDVVLHFVRKGFVHPDGTDALGGLGLCDYVLAVQPLVGFVDAKRLLLKVEVLRGQCQHLAQADTAPVQHLEGVVHGRLVHHLGGKLQILLLRPEEHLLMALMAHVAGDGCGIALQPVITYRMVEDAGDLCMDGLEIARGIGLAIRLALLHHRVLPGNNVPGFDLTDHAILEIGKDLRFDDVPLGDPGVLADAILLVSIIDLHESPEGHVQVGALLEQELPLPLQRVPLALKAAFQLFALGSRVVGVVEGYIIGSLLLVRVVLSRMFSRI